MLPPSCQSINLWNTKKVKINERCVQKVCRYIRWMKLASKRSEDRLALPWSMTGVLPFMGFIHLRQIGAMCPSVQPTALEKPNSTYSPNESVESNNKKWQEAGLGGGSLFEVRRYQIDVNNHIEIHISLQQTHYVSATDSTDSSTFVNDGSQC